VTEMQANLTFADERGIGNHGKRSRGAIGKFNVDDLVIANVVGGFVHTLAVGSLFESLGDVFNVWNTIYQDTDRPRCMTRPDRVKINCNFVSAVAMGRERYYFWLHCKGIRHAAMDSRNTFLHLELEVVF